MPETWIDGVIREPGPPHKNGYPFDTFNEAAGAVVHSAEGSLESTLNVLRGPRRVSWHFTIPKNQVAYQHYPLEAVCWHAGVDANVRLVGIECEGVAGEPLTDRQVSNLRIVLRELAHVRGWPALERGLTLFEHNEFMPTACPSGRIPWEQLVGAPEPPPAPSIDAQLSALTAALAVLWTHHHLADLPAGDREVLRYVSSQL